MRTLTDVRRDLVQTIRQVVDVVSKYAGGALPEPARTRVRGFILKLPQRWSSKTGVTVPSVNTVAEGDRERESVTAAASGSGAVRRSNRRAPYRERGTGADSKTSSRAASPSSPRVARNSIGGAQSSGDAGSSAEPVVSAGAAVLAAQRILTLATESLDMMRGVTGVMKDSLDRADAYVLVYLGVIPTADSCVDGSTVYARLEFRETNPWRNLYRKSGRASSDTIGGVARATRQRTTESRLGAIIHHRHPCRLCLEPPRRIRRPTMWQAWQAGRRPRVCCLLCHWEL